MTTHVRIHDVSQLLTAANIPHDRYDGACGTPDCIEFRPLDSDGTATLRFDDRHGWVLDSQVELSEGVLGPVHTVKLAVPDASALGVAAAVEGVYRGLVDEFEILAQADASRAREPGDYDGGQCMDCECCTRRQCSLNYCSGRCPCTSA